MRFRRLLLANLRSPSRLKYTLRRKIRWEIFRTVVKITRKQKLHEDRILNRLYALSVMQIGLNSFKIVNKGLNYCRDHISSERRQKDGYYQGYFPHSIPSSPRPPFVWPLAGHDRQYSRSHKMLTWAV